MPGLYAEHLETHVLPTAEKNFDVKLTINPDGREAMAEFPADRKPIMAWYYPEFYHHVLKGKGYRHPCIDCLNVGNGYGPALEAAIQASVE